MSQYKPLARAVTKPRLADNLLVVPAGLNGERVGPLLNQPFHYVKTGYQAAKVEALAGLDRILVHVMVAAVTALALVGFGLLCDQCVAGQQQD